MVRYREISPSANEDRTQRSKKKQSGENSESSATGQKTSEGKKALYQCNYCHRDLTGWFRMKCATCPDFDLCEDCFSVGAELYPHKSNHPYRVMGDLSFPLFCPDWNADEEILLLEALGIYGLGDWAEIAQHVGTKSKEQCIDHYTNVYINSPFFPLPDMSHFSGKNTEELDDGHIQDNKDLQMDGSDKGKKPASSDESDRGKKPASSDNEALLMNLSGYNPKRQEFTPEYDNDAEQLLADMEFKDTDTECERELKLRVIRIYNNRIDERKRRKDFILERNLLYPNPFEKDLSAEEKAICRRYDVFMRFHSRQEHEDLLRSIIVEHRTQKKIQELREARAAGCHTSAQVNIYIERKRKRETEESAKGAESSQFDMGSQVGGINYSVASESVGNHSSSSATTISVNDLLSESEKRLCMEIKLPPALYLKVQEVISKEIFKGNVTKKSDAHPLFNLHFSQIDSIYDVLVKKGIAKP